MTGAGRNGRAKSEPTGAAGESSPAMSLAEALAHHRAGRLDSAEAGYRRILRSDPENVDALHLLGVIAKQTGHLDAAIELMARAVAGKPDFAEAHNNLANALEAGGRLEEAVAAYRRAIEIRPDFAEAHYNLGNAYRAGRRFEEAADAYACAVEIRPDHAEAHSNLGNVLAELGRPAEAVAAHGRAIAIRPDHAEAHNNLGVALQAEGRLAEAVAAYERAVALRPDYVEAHSNLGNGLKEEGRIADALAAFGRAIELRPDYAEAHFNLSLSLHLKGEAAAWREYEWRFEAESESKRRPFPQAGWEGSSLSGRTILVWGEQGIGDEIMFASLLPELTARAGRVLIECDARLAPLFERSLRGLAVVPRTTPPAERLLGDDIDFQCPAGSLCHLLGHLLGLDALSLGASQGYLKPDPERRARLRAVYQERFPGKRLVGISWRSGNRSNARIRTAELSEWLPVLGHPGTAFVNLQYGEVGEELARFAAETGIEVFDDASVNPLASLEDFAAQVAALDLVVSIDNSTVHVAGALGVPVWTLLPDVPDWRWTLEGEATPWYASARLLRQRGRGGWADVFRRARAALDALEPRT